MLISEKITLFIAAWIIIMLFATGDAAIEIFFVLIFIGILIAKELTYRFTVTQLKNRMNIFIFMFLIVFIAVVGKKIMDFISID